MKDIKEYFTANKHPLISRLAGINQRLRAATGPERDDVHDSSALSLAVSPVAARRVSAAAAGRWPHQQPPAWRSYTKFNQRSTALVNPSTGSNKVLCPT